MNHPTLHQSYNYTRADSGDDTDDLQNHRNWGRRRRHISKGVMVVLIEVHIRSIVEATKSHCREMKKTQKPVKFE